MDNIIRRLHFREAKTMKNIPHEYAVKSDYNKKDYENLFKHILTNHYIRYFYGKPYMYCDIGEYTYWIMSDDIKVSKIINRVRKED